MGINTIHAKDLERSGITWNSLADPCTNVKVGASILSKCFAKYGDTWEGVGCYNSQTPSKRNRYAKLIYNLIEREKTKQKQQPAQTQVTSLQPQPANETSPWLLIESDYVSR
jgi:soluble lytic murein transglycosylase-like protein